MNDTLAQIQELKLQLENIQRAVRYQKELERKLSAERAKLDRLAAEMDKEQQDVTDLEKWSIRDLFVKVLDREERLEQEKEEYLQAALAYQEGKKEVDLLEFELGVLAEKIALLPGVESELEQLYLAREEELLHQDEDHPLKAIRQQLARWQQIDRELEEAILRGNNASVMLTEIAQHLNRAKSWISNNPQNYSHHTHIISQEIDLARLRLPKLRLEYSKFEQELKEVLSFSELDGRPHNEWDGLRQIQEMVHQLSQFTQILLQGLVRMITLPTQLHQTHTLTDNLRYQTDNNIRWLQLEQGEARQHITHLENEKRNLLT